MRTRGKNVDDVSVKKKNAVCNPMENIIIVLTPIKIVREIKFFRISAKPMYLGSIPGKKMNMNVQMT